VQKSLCIAALLSAVALAGCMSTAARMTDDSKPTVQQCTAGQWCGVDVDVLCKWGIFCGASGPDRVEVSNAAKTPATLTWTIPPKAILENVYFAKDGIAFQDSGFACSISGDAKSFQCIDTAGLGDHKYTITLIWRNNLLTISPNDPWVVNK
jgi:hypothetical protein